MDSFFELIFGSFLDKLILKTKQFRAQLILMTYSKKNIWINEIENEQTYKEIVKNDENLLNLFLDKHFRNRELKDVEKRKEYIENIKKSYKEINDI